MFGLLFILLRKKNLHWKLCVAIDCLVRSVHNLLNPLLKVNFKFEIKLFKFVLLKLLGKTGLRKLPVKN